MKDKIPAHVGIIMDGNGRWAGLRGLPRFEGHRRGAERAKEIIDACSDLGISCLTLFAFSTENWQRPADEVGMLMKLLELYLKNEFSGLVMKNVVFRAIGQIDCLPKNIQALIRDTEEKTAKNSGLHLTAALSYSGRNEIIRAVRRLIASNIDPSDITEEKFSSFLDTAGLPQPDLIIRTSGEQRLSNFLLWQAAYSEFYFTDTLWPDFDRDEFMLAIRDYQQRERRFGNVSVRSDAY